MASDMGVLAFFDTHGGREGGGILKKQKYGDQKTFQA